MRWTEERVEQLRTAWASGKSTSQIAGDMGTTKNSVVGKLDRMGLPARQHRAYGKARRTSHMPDPVEPRRANGSRVIALEHALGMRDHLPKRGMLVVAPDLAGSSSQADLPLQTPLAERKSLVDLEPHDCRFPFGDGPFTFCGRRKVDGVSYCEDHVKACYQPPVPRRIKPNVNWDFRIVGTKKVDA